MASLILDMYNSGLSVYEWIGSVHLDIMCRMELWESIT